ncbi:hypothetical protein [Propioniciclava coleopterorum]|uniref:hypothetical protein n=1 Tax=Propioniciclava coleopterorum TaxID=2714937 RepID=UPI0019823A8D|nr:hypothetical protein [Propioniciclava coleopterorum]
MKRTTQAVLIATTLATALTASLFSPAADAAPSRHGSPTVPKRVALTPRDFGERIPLALDTGNYPDQPASVGQYCDVTGNGAEGTEPRPLGGRQWNWLTADQRTSVTEVVTVWGDAAHAFDQVVSDTGYCRYAALDYPNYTPQVVFDGTTFVASWDGTVVLTTQVDRSLVSVSITGDGSAGDLSERGLHLLDRAVARTDRANI